LKGLGILYVVVFGLVILSGPTDIFSGNVRLAMSPPHAGIFTFASVGLLSQSVFLAKAPAALKAVDAGPYPGINIAPALPTYGAAF
jgi:hypothetical protein